MEKKIEKKIKDLKEFIKQKTDQGTANYLGKEIIEICGMVEIQALSQHDVSRRSEQVDCIHKTSRLRIIGRNLTCLDCKTTWRQLT